VTASTWRIFLQKDTLSVQASLIYFLNCSTFIHCAMQLVKIAIGISVVQF